MVNEFGWHTPGASLSKQAPDHSFTNKTTCCISILSMTGKVAVGDHCNGRFIFRNIRYYEPIADTSCGSDIKWIVAITLKLMCAIPSSIRDTRYGHNVDTLKQSPKLVTLS